MAVSKEHIQLLATLPPHEAYLLCGMLKHDLIHSTLMTVVPPMPLTLLAEAINGIQTQAEAYQLYQTVHRLSGGRVIMAMRMDDGTEGRSL